MSIAKVTLRFDVLPEEKGELETICDSLHITKIEFLRRAIAQDKGVYFEDRKNNESACLDCCYRYKKGDTHE